LTAPFNDLDAAVKLVRDNPRGVAAIIVEPVVGNSGFIPPDPGFLQGLRALADNSGALLIFDEVMTGFRIAAGGAKERFGVTADLTTLGKVIGGGLPVAAYGGRRDIMERVAPSGPVYQAGTLSGNPLAMAANRDADCAPPAFTRIERLRIVEGLQKIAMVWCSVLCRERWIEGILSAPPPCVISGCEGVRCDLFRRHAALTRSLPAPSALNRASCQPRTEMRKSRALSRKWEKRWRKRMPKRRWTEALGLAEGTNGARAWLLTTAILWVAACVSLSSPRGSGVGNVPVVRGTFKGGAQQQVRIALETAAEMGPVTAEADSFLIWNGKRYRGRITFTRTDSGFIVVNSLPMDSYLRGVVPLEIGNRTPAEFAAVQAQAVAARTYAYKHLTSSRAFDMYATVQDQVYGGVDAEKPQSDSAITTTADVVVLYNGQPITTPYHSTCGGSTAGVSEV
jgi:hypothetical protein